MIGENDDEPKENDEMGHAQISGCDNMRKRSSYSLSNSSSTELSKNNNSDVPDSCHDIKVLKNIKSTVSASESYTKDELSEQEWDDKVSKVSKVSRGIASNATAKSIEFRLKETVVATMSNYMEYRAFLIDYDHSKSVYIYFTGTDSPNSGYSWCVTCRKAFPLIELALKHVYGSILLIVLVGSQEEWEDRSNPYRLDASLKLKVLPTLLKYKTHRRLEGDYCLKSELLELLFEDDVDDF